MPPPVVNSYNYSGGYGWGRRNMLGDKEENDCDLHHCGEDDSDDGEYTVLDWKD